MLGRSAPEGRHRRRVRRFVIGAAVVMATVALLILGLFAIAGGLRIRTPIGAMNQALDRLELRQARLVASTEQGERLCFVQCEEWRVERFFALDERSPSGGDAGQLCAQLETVAAAWFGSAPRGGVATSEEQRRYYECGYVIRGLAEDPDWCAELHLLPLDYEWMPEADVSATVGIEC